MSLPIGVVLKRMTFADLQAAAAVNERERKAAEKDAAIQRAQAQARIAAEAANRRRIAELGRPEYLFAKNAERKEDKRLRWYANRERERQEIAAKRLARSKARRAQGRPEL